MWFYVVLSTEYKTRIQFYYTDYNVKEEKCTFYSTERYGLSILVQINKNVHTSSALNDNSIKIYFLFTNLVL